MGSYFLARRAALGALVGAALKQLTVKIQQDNNILWLKTDESLLYVYMSKYAVKPCVLKVGGAQHNRVFW